jgi:hypothetical protein
MLLVPAVMRLLGRAIWWIPGWLDRALPRLDVEPAARAERRLGPGEPRRRIARVVPEARLEQTEAGLVPASAGWFVMNARDARWMEQPGHGHSLPLTGADEEPNSSGLRLLN